MSGADNNHRNAIYAAAALIPLGQGALVLGEHWPRAAAWVLCLAASLAAAIQLGRIFPRLRRLKGAPLDPGRFAAAEDTVIIEVPEAVERLPGALRRLGYRVHLSPGESGAIMGHAEKGIPRNAAVLALHLLLLLSCLANLARVSTIEQGRIALLADGQTRVLANAGKAAQAKWSARLEEIRVKDERLIIPQWPTKGPWERFAALFGSGDRLTAQAADSPGGCRRRAIYDLSLHAAGQQMARGEFYAAQWLSAGGLRVAVEQPLPLPPCSAAEGSAALSQFLRRSLVQVVWIHDPVRPLFLVLLACSVLLLGVCLFGRHHRVLFMAKADRVFFDIQETNRLTDRRILAEYLISALA